MQISNTPFGEKALSINKMLGHTQVQTTARCTIMGVLWPRATAFDPKLCHEPELDAGFMKAADHPERVG